MLTFEKLQPNKMKSCGPSLDMLKVPFTLIYDVSTERVHGNPNFTDVGTGEQEVVFGKIFILLVS